MNGENLECMPKVARRKYSMQKSCAKKRGIGWEISPREWWGIWRGSGCWNQRGNKKGMYCMSRPGDVGPYAPWNVNIVRFESNISEAAVRPRPAMLGNKHTLGMKLKLSEGEVEKRRARMLGNQLTLGRKEPIERLAEKSEFSKKMHDERRRLGLPTPNGRPYRCA